jgi:hypothetical protein
MKQFLMAMTLLAVMTACQTNPVNSNPSKKDTVVVVDTVKMPADKAQTPAEEKKESNRAGRTYHEENKSTTINAPAASSQNETTAAESTPAKPKGWSASAKGAAIGGATGIVAGAVLDRKSRVAGGLIGGLVGAGAGYLIGRERDKKTGRIVKHKSSN